MNNNPVVLLTCEHGGNNVPPTYKPLFTKQEALLNSHCGMDFGALEIAQQLSQLLNTKLISTETTRLLIDCNRSLHHRYCFSSTTKPLAEPIKQQIITEHYLPYRQAIEEYIQTQLNQHHPVIHLSIHSFVPTLHGTLRNTDIGLLYDSQKSQEKIFARHWQAALKKQSDQLKVRLNYPYQGKSDGFTTTLRTKHPSNVYLGIEVEINQALLSTPDTPNAIAQLLFKTLPINSNIIIID